MSNLELILIHLFELIAALTGSIYLNKHREDISSRYFVWFLWFTVIVEKLGLMKRLIQEFDLFSFLDNTFLVKPNYWIYNPYLLISVIFYTWYFIFNINSKSIKKKLAILSVFYFVSSIISFFLVKGQFFKSYSTYCLILGSLLILLSVLLYFFEVFKSDIILNFNKSIPFYISIGTLIFHLTVTPLLIYSKYYITSLNPEFVKIYTNILTGANIIMYTCYSFGFIVCFRKNKSY